MQRIGILGVGELTEKVVIGLRRSGFTGAINLSPRNHERAVALSTSCECKVMTSNQEVADNADILILGVRPDAVARVAEEVTLPKGILLISLVAGMTSADLQASLKDATVVRGMLSYAAALNQTTVVLTPANPTAESLLSPLGSLVVLPTESQFELATVTACMNGWFYYLLGDLQQMLVNQGIAADDALRLVTGNMQDCLAVIQANPEQSPQALGSTIATPGTYTAAGLEVLKQQNYSAAWQAASEHVLHKLTHQKRS